jgi:stearoyl-CoA desaturase (delta-9 desaturase)
MQCFVNSLTHMGHSEEGDSSKNVWWLGPLQLTAWGENWHRNHHQNAGSARFGLHRWQTDIGWYLICALEAAGLASNVRRPRDLCGTRRVLPISGTKRLYNTEITLNLGEK